MVVPHLEFASYSFQIPELAIVAAELLASLHGPWCSFLQQHRMQRGNGPRPFLNTFPKPSFFCSPAWQTTTGFPNTFRKLIASCMRFATFSFFKGNGAKNDFRGFVSRCVHHRFPRRMHVHTTRKIKPCLRDKKRNKLSLVLAEKVQVWELHFFRKLPVTSRFDSLKKENEGKLTKILFLMTCFEPNLNGVIYPSTVCVCKRDRAQNIFLFGLCELMYMWWTVFK